MLPLYKGAKLGTKPHMKNEDIMMARISAAQGLKGEVRVTSFAADPPAFGDYGPLHDAAGRKFEVVSARLHKNVVVAKFRGVDDRNGAEALKGVELFVARSKLPDEADDDEFYLSDLEGLAVVDVDGAPFGTVIAVWNHGAGDILEIQPVAGKSELYSFTERNFPHIDVDAGQITIDPPLMTGDEAGESAAQGEE